MALLFWGKGRGAARPVNQIYQKYQKYQEYQESLALLTMNPIRTHAGITRSSKKRPLVENAF